jgi:hypothetical protein
MNIFSLKEANRYAYKFIRYGSAVFPPLEKCSDIEIHVQNSSLALTISDRALQETVGERNGNTTGKAIRSGSFPHASPAGCSRQWGRPHTEGSGSENPCTSQSILIFLRDVSKRALQWYSKCYCVASVTKTFTLKGVSRVEAGKNTSNVIPASRKRQRKGNWISLRWDSASRPERRLMRTYFWISLFTSYSITAN